MENTMQARKTLIALLMTSALAASASVALAHAPGQGHGPGRGVGMGPNAEWATQRMADLKSALKLTPAQDAAWASFEDAQKRAFDGRAKLRESMQGMRGNPDAMADARVAMLKFNAQSAEEINNARKALATTLTPEQKATFDQFRGAGMMAGGGRGPGGGGPGYGPGYGHGQGHHHGPGQGRGPGACGGPATST
jgi:Spy/CpxP family protein refolding chaperone